jgi:hypothetical protein
MRLPEMTTVALLLIAGSLKLPVAYVEYGLVQVDFNYFLTGL